LNLARVIAAIYEGLGTQRSSNAGVLGVERVIATGRSQRRKNQPIGFIELLTLHSVAETLANTDEKIFLDQGYEYFIDPVLAFYLGDSVFVHSAESPMNREFSIKSSRQ